MMAPSYCFKAIEDLPDIGLAAGESLFISPHDKEHPIIAARAIEITPVQFFDAIMAGQLKPQCQCPTDGDTNPLLAVRNAMRWPWQEPAEPVVDDSGPLTKEQAADVVHDTCAAVMGTDPYVVLSELYRAGYRMTGPKPSIRRSGLKLETG